ncbi:MAG TPA: DUF3078 domain-containing protein [Chitinophagales bacterium]|nr:DUF3078 domain-containing protein [Chitinophagales bacterium]
MKKIIFVLAVISFSIANTFSQIDTIWTIGGLSTLTFNQNSLTNWASGGENSFSGNAFINLYANYNFEKSSWDNMIMLNYGVVTANDNQDIRKNNDRMELNSKYGRYAFGKFYYSGLVNFLSQFRPGYDYIVDPQATTPISDFMVPGYLTLSAGLDYKPTEYFSLFLSPATGKFTFVKDPYIAALGTYGNTPGIIDSLGNIVEDGASFRSEFGASVIATLSVDLAPKFNTTGKLTLFNNFTDPVKANRGNIDVNFYNTFSYALGKLFTLSLYFEVIYDHDIIIPIYNDANVQIDEGPRTQFKEIFGIGLSYTIGDKLE